MSEVTEQAFAVLVRHRFGIHEERKAAARHVVDERNQSEFGQRPQLSVQIDIGVYLLNLCLGKKRQLQKVLHSCRIYVHGVLGKFLQLLQM